MAFFVVSWPKLNLMAETKLEGQQQMQAEELSVEETL